MWKTSRQPLVFPAIVALVLLLVSAALLTSCGFEQSGNEGKMTERIPEIVMPSEAEIESIKTANYDMVAIADKGLSVDDMVLSEEYVYLQAVYRAGFNRWLDRDGLLSGFDAKLRADSRGFVPVAQGEQEYAQKYASYGRDYVFILNSFFIERLSEEDLELLREVSSIDDEVLEELVIRTYEDVIEVREDNGRLSSSVIYSTTIGGLWEAPADAIALEIRYRAHTDSSEAIDWTLEAEKEADVNKWRDALAKALYEQTDTRSYVFINAL
jgi:hypothetical protein